MSLTTPATPATDSAPSDGSPTTTRRQVLITGGVVAAAVAVTAACGSSSSSAPATSAPAAAAAAAAPTTVKTADVPVGGGTIVVAAKVVVTQPTAGQYKAFSAVCTHKGCIVASVKDGTISCACHGSAFSAADGSVKNGPAAAPLAAVPVTVSGDTITLA